MEKHAAIARHFCTPDLGLRLQHADSEIMADVMDEMTSRGILVLPVHDSAVVADRHVGALIEAMRRHYEVHTGFPPLGLKVTARGVGMAAHVPFKHAA